MMKHTDSKNSDNPSGDEAIDRSNDFGSALAEARKAKDLSEEEISEHIKIPVQIVMAIENNDIDSLPAATYTQGYIRSYAKFLELPVDDLLQKYGRAVPHKLASDLKPRSNLPNEASSQSPLVKLLTIILIVAGLGTLGYGIFQYYQEKADDMGSERESRDQPFTGNSLDSPGTLPGFRASGRDDRSSEPREASPEDGHAQPLTIRQDARLSEDGELILTGDNSSENRESTDDAGTAAAPGSDMVAEPSAEPAAEPVEVMKADQAAPATDVVEVYAEMGTWLEVYDAGKQRLFYNMLQEGSSKLLSGRAPFRIKLGNARSTQVSVNNRLVDMTPYIRSNNTVIITVSTDGKDVIFH
ncbi:MAG: helix-turn-helix domain-containing protein [Proteobacteria bacterium]|nr:helix-turn-helix domain-containing protein [Pseudomonadota bacterium]